MEYRLKIENFGKIKKANIKVTPFTLLIGDNNSGKSYLLSLIWALASRKTAMEFIDTSKKEEMVEYQELYSKLSNGIKKKEIGGSFSISTKSLEKIWNRIFENGIEEFLNKIFNYNGVKIGKLELELEEKEIIFTKQSDSILQVKIGDKVSSSSINIIEKLDVDYVEILIMFLLVQIFNYTTQDNTVYLPAARTGFMLSKDVINQVSRRKTFDFIIDSDEEMVRPDFQPFTKPIMHFLDKIERATVENEEKNRKFLAITNWMEAEVTRGSIQYQELGNKEVRYVPKGEKEGLPLRTSSAVITELTPLILLLKYSQVPLRVICYEEPEMCLHPQLQLEMGKLLIRLVNSGVQMIVTTHSDIILQHINNMCRLCKIKHSDEIMEEFKLKEEDKIDSSKISIYQLTNCGEYSEVEELKEEESGFYIPTFSNALMKILEQTTAINDIAEDKE